MKLIPLLLAFCLSPAFAQDSITVDRATNIFNTDIGVSSSSMRAVRIGKSDNIGTVLFNAPGYTPVKLQNVAGHLTYNGVAITTDAFVGDDMAVVDDLTVGDAATITGAVMMSSTLDVNGVATVGKLDTGYGQNELFDMDQHMLTSSAVSFTGLTNLGKMKLYSRTMAELLLISPAAVGEVYFCSNCSPAKMAVSTGTAAGNFSDAVGGEFK